MSEPNAKMGPLTNILPGIWHGTVKDDRIGGARSESYAIVDAGRVVLVDPLPVDDDAWRALGEVEAVVLTAGNHQRSAWRVREAFSVPVYAPVNAFGLEHRADYAYSGGDLLPGALTAIHAPGPVDSMHALWRPGVTNAVFLSDLLVNDGSGHLRFVPSEYQDEPWRTRESVRRIADGFPVTALLFAHGAPVLNDGRRLLARALDEDADYPQPHV